jgi:hypothetical protein
MASLNTTWLGQGAARSGGAFERHDGSPATNPANNRRHPRDRRGIPSRLGASRAPCRPESLRSPAVVAGDLSLRGRVLLAQVHAGGAGRLLADWANVRGFVALDQTESARGFSIARLAGGGAARATPTAWFRCGIRPPILRRFVPCVRIDHDAPASGNRSQKRSPQSQQPSPRRHDTAEQTDRFAHDPSPGKRSSRCEPRATGKGANRTGTAEPRAPWNGKQVRMLTFRESQRRGGTS